ncbi:MAG TPA: chemotaxis protein CheW [Terriglobales bacterium]|nr:chemotaxis protein CheW [Terriglobales bacterium]
MASETCSEEALLVSVFRLGEALFGIPAAQIQEVVQMGNVTPVHHAPPFIVGIRNLRGRIVTVVDLRLRLELGEAERSADSRILIVDTEGELVGLLVDRVDDTIFLRPESMSPPPSNLGALQESVLLGIYRCPDGLVTLLDHNAILKPGERAAGAGAGRH